LDTVIAVPVEGHAAEADEPGDVFAIALDIDIVALRIGDSITPRVEQRTGLGDGFDHHGGESFGHNLLRDAGNAAASARKVPDRVVLQADDNHFDIRLRERRQRLEGGVVSRFGADGDAEGAAGGVERVSAWSAGRKVAPVAPGTG
jgi:hypothetical protein